MKGAVFIATSLDGFIARPDGRIDWLDRASSTAPKGEDFGYQKFFDSVDALVLGRRTFDFVRSFDGPWPYGSKRVVVLSRGKPEIPDSVSNTVSAWSGTPGALVETLAAEGIRRAYVDGGQAIQSFLREGLIDEMTITVIPTLLGSGIRLFGDVEQDIELEHLETRSWDCGFVQVRYRIRH